MSTKKSVFLSTRTVEWIESTTKIDGSYDGPKWSESINATFDQLRFLLKSELPDLSVEEWTIILNVYTGCYLPAHCQPARIASDMMDNFGAIDLADLSDENRACVEKMHALSQCAQLAVLYFAQIFLSASWTGEWTEIVEGIKNKF